MRSRSWLATLAVGCALVAPAHAFAQKAGGFMRVYHRDTPPSASIHEEATTSTNMPFMSVYNNLVVFDQNQVKNTLDTIVPDLATSWAWDDSKTRLTFKLREGVAWHDGKPFTAADVKCTWDMLRGTGATKLRKNPRKSWYWNLKGVSTNGDHEATFELGQPQPSFVALLASGYSPVYPCHVSPKDMRTNPVGTGPFKFVEMKQNEAIKLVRNENYWKPGRPYLDGVEWRIIASRSTRILAFVAGEFDLTFSTDVTVPLIKDVKDQAPHAICEKVPTGVSTNLIVNRDVAPFDNENVRKAMNLAIDRDAYITILSQGEDQRGGAMLPPPAGAWGMSPEMLASVPGYGDKETEVAAAQALMQQAGYGEANRLAVKVSTRNIAIYRDPAVILIDQLKKIYIDAELETVETSNWHAKVARKDYQVGLNLTGVGVDDPDVNYFENYACGSERNYTGYCNAEVQALLEKQAGMTDVAARRELVWQIDRKLQEDVARPIIFHGVAATCYQPYLKGFHQMVNSSYNGWRFEDVWLDK